MFVRDDGIYQWSGGASVEKISLALDDRYWSNLNVARLPYSFAMYYPAQEQVWFFLPYGASQTTMNSVVIYSARLNAWFGPYNGFARDSAALIDDLPHAGDFAGASINTTAEQTMTVQPYADRLRQRPLRRLVMP